MLAYIFLLLAVAVRLVAGTGAFATYGFSPLGAALLFFGARTPRKYYWLPLALLVPTDIYLNRAAYGIPLHWDQVVVWAWYVGACFLGSLLKGRTNPLTVGGASLSASISFFLISNFAVWASWNMYPRTWHGLVTCYSVAVPFFRSGLVSDLLFSAIFFSVPYLVTVMGRSSASKTAAI